MHTGRIYSKLKVETNDMPVTNEEYWHKSLLQTPNYQTFLLISVRRIVLLIGCNMSSLHDWDCRHKFSDFVTHLSTHQRKDMFLTTTNYRQLKLVCSFSRAFSLLILHRLNFPSPPKLVNLPSSFNLQLLVFQTWFQNNESVDCHLFQNLPNNLKQRF